MPLYNCRLCSQPHGLRSCQLFLSLNVEDRFSVVSGYNYCWICLAQSHTFQLCASKFRCRICRRRHNTLLHDHRINAICFSDANYNHRSLNKRKHSSSNVSKWSINSIQPIVDGVDADSSTDSSSSSNSSGIFKSFRKLSITSSIGSNRSNASKSSKRKKRTSRDPYFTKRSDKDQCFLYQSPDYERFMPRFNSSYNNRRKTRGDSLDVIAALGYRIINEVISTLQDLQDLQK